MIEVATSGRSTCKGCKKAIAKGELRYGDEVPGNFDGMMTFWYHLACAVEHRPEDFAAVLAGYKGVIPERSKLEAGLVGATIAAKTKRFQKVDRAPTGRAKCQACKRKIALATLRVAIVRIDGMPGFGSAFLHVACVPDYVGGDADAAMLARAAKGDRPLATAILNSRRLLDTEARGKELESGVHLAKKKPTAEISVLSDWLEEQGAALPLVELEQLLHLRKKKPTRKRSG